MKERESLISVQRIILDQEIVKAAQRAGAKLRENVNVKSAHLNHNSSSKEEEDYWSILINSESSNSFGEKILVEKIIKSRLLVCADGANSNVAKNLTGLKSEECPSQYLGPPNAIGCRAFVKGGTHLCRADEVIFYNSDMLPGSFRISRELEDFLNLTCFVLPSDDYSTSQLPLHALHQFTNAIENEPSIQAILGHGDITNVRSAPMRVGGVTRTYFPHGLIVGDAAGQQDPLTGDGLQYGMLAGKMAANVLFKALNEKNYSSQSMMRYEHDWKNVFGWDFFWGRKIVYLIARFPLLVDAVALVIQRHGIKAISFWALAKSGIKSKWELILWFLRPDVAWLMIYYSLNLWFRSLDIY